MVFILPEQRCGAPRTVPTHIYVLEDPTDISTSVYVGMTVDPRVRISLHCSPNHLTAKTMKNNWVKSLAARGVRPKMVVVETVPPGADYQEAERFWIASLRALGLRMLNGTDGGTGQRPGPSGKRRTAAQSAKFSVAQRCRKVTARNVTGFKGVHVQKRATGYLRYFATIKENGTHRFISSHDTAEDAARAYDERARQLWGSAVSFNFPRPGELSARRCT